MRIRVGCVSSMHSVVSMHKGSHLLKLLRARPMVMRRRAGKPILSRRVWEHATGGTHGGVKLAAWGRRRLIRSGPVSSLSAKFRYSTALELSWDRPFLLEARILMKARPLVGANHAWVRVAPVVILQNAAWLTMETSQCIGHESQELSCCG